MRIKLHHSRLNKYINIRAWVPRSRPSNRQGVSWDVSLSEWGSPRRRRGACKGWPSQRIDVTSIPNMAPCIKINQRDYVGKYNARHKKMGRPDICQTVQYCSFCPTGSWNGPLEVHLKSPLEAHLANVMHIFLKNHPKKRGFFLLVPTYH